MDGLAFEAFRRVASRCLFTAAFGTDARNAPTGKER
jgi:hypothetical protein